VLLRESLVVFMSTVAFGFAVEITTGTFQEAPLYVTTGSVTTVVAPEASEPVQL